MEKTDWQTSFIASITVCDADGVILEMNEVSSEELASYGGRTLIGSNVLDCHPEPSRSKLAAMLKDKKENIYSIEKNGKKKLVYQTPWYKDGQYAGFVEMILPLPADLPHYKRD